MTRKPNFLFMLLVSLLLIAQFPGAGSVKAAGDVVQVSKVVNPAKIIEGEETEVTLNVQGSPDVTVVKPNDIILIIDRSGSMSSTYAPNKGEDKMKNAKEAAKGFIDLVDFSKHRVGVVDFSSNVRYKDLSTNPEELKSYIDTIQSSGGTGTKAAVAKAQELLRNHRADAQPAILLMTDGEATEPGPETYARQVALEQANSAKTEGVIFYTIALLLPNENPDTSAPNILMKEMATTAQHHHFVLGSIGLAQIYEAIVEEIGLASAYNVVITDQVSSNFEIVPDSYKDNIPQPSVVGNTLTWKFNELKKEALTFKYKIRHKTGAEVGSISVGEKDINVKYNDYLNVGHESNVANPNITVSYAAPTITSVDKDNGTIQGGETVTINGTHFLPNPAVMFGTKSAGSVQYVDSTKLIVTAPAGAQGTVDLKVTNTDGQFATAQYSYFVNPVITSVTPNLGPLAGGNDVTIQGNYFMTGAKVLFGAGEATIVSVTPTKIVVKAPASPEEKTVDVKVVNPDKTEVTTAGAYTYVTGPAITELTPNKGMTTGGESVTLTGSKLLNGAKVYFDTTEVTTSFVSSTSLKLVTPKWTQAGPVKVKVVNPDGQSIELANGYTYEYPAPTITTVTPSEGPVAGGTLVYIKGSDFVNGAKVYFDNTLITLTTFTNSSEIIVRTPSWTKGETLDVKLVNPDGKEATVADGFTYLLPTSQTLTSIAPVEGPLAGGTAVTLKGTNFTAGVRVYLDNTQVTPSSITATEIKFTTPKWAVAEKVDVRVVDTYGQEAVLTDAFTYLAPPPPAAPKIASVTPNSGPIAGGTLVSITGSDFVSGLKVYVNDKDVTASSTLSSKTLLYVRMPAWATADTVSLKIVNPDNQSAVADNAYTYLAPPSPTLTSIAPVEGPLAGGTAVTLKGTNFTSGVKVYLDNTQVAPSSVTATEIKFTTPKWAAAEKVDVRITDSYGREAVLTDAYTYLAPPPPVGPKITGVSPNSGPQAGGTLISITGSDFVSGLKVYVNDKDVTASSTLSNKTLVYVRMPAWATADTVSLKIVNPDNQSAVADNAYTYIPLPGPSIASLTPNKGLISGGTAVSIQGSNFVNGAKLQLGTKDVAATFMSATQLQFRTPAWSTGESVDITVTNPDGQKAVLTKGYTFELPAPDPAPTISGITPNSGEQAGGTLVYINGSNFVSGAKVYLDNTAVAATFNNKTQLIVRTPAWATAEKVDVKVVNPDNQSVTMTDGYTFLAPPPKAGPEITSVSPAEGETTGGQLITVTGNNFEAGTKIYFNDTALASTFYNAKTIMVKTPQWSRAEAVDVKAVNPDKQVGTLSGGYNFILPPPPPAPVVNSLSPQEVPLTGNTIVSLSGKNFINGAKVKLGTVEVPVTFMSTTQLVIKTPAWANPDSVDVTVTNPDGQSGTLSGGLNYILGPPPMITSITPNSALNTGGDIVVINGSNYNSSTKVYINNVAAATTFYSATDVRARVPASNITGPVDVKVVNENDGQYAVATEGLTYTPPAPKPGPTISSITPNSGSVSGGYIINVYGTYFTSTSKVYVNNVLAPSTFYNASQFLIRVPASSVAGPVDIKVVNPDNQEVVLSGGFTYN